MLSIGLAVFNGERYLRDSVDSILAQTFTDFELIISDNASTDQTGDICREYASKDKRIRYSRNDVNIGGANNENRTFLFSRGKYFRWAAYDDVCAPDLFRECLAVLEHDLSVVLCHSVVIEIDENGKTLATLDRNKAAAEQPSERFRSLTKFDYNCEETYGFIRSDILRETKLQQNYTDSDRTLLSELGLHGKFHQVPKPLFFRRVHPAMSTKVYSNWRERMVWFDAENKDRILLPHWLQFFDYLRVIGRVGIGWGQRIACYAHMVRWITSQGHGRWMAKDLLLAAMKLLRSIIRPKVWTRNNIAVPAAPSGTT